MTTGIRPRTSAVSVLIVDDDPIVRGVLRKIIERTPGAVCVGELGEADSLPEAAERLHPDVVLLDVRMPGRDPLEAAMEVLSMVDPPKIIVVAASMQGWLVRGALAFGAAGFVLKDDVPSSLPTAIREVMQGRKYLSPTVRLMHPDEV